MKYLVFVRLDVDPTDYVEGVDTPEGACTIVNEMLNGAADIPVSDCTIVCGTVIQKGEEI